MLLCINVNFVDNNGNVFGFGWMAGFLDGTLSVKKSITEGTVVKRKPKSYGGVPRPSVYTAKWVIASIEILSPAEMIDDHVYYRIRATSTANWTWIIKRRYSDFVRFQSNLDMRDPKHLLPKPTNALPEKDINSKKFTVLAKSQGDVDKRSKALSAYLLEQLKIANGVYKFDDTTEAIRRLRGELNYFLETKLNTGYYLTRVDAFAHAWIANKLQLLIRGNLS